MSILDRPEAEMSWLFPVYLSVQTCLLNRIVLQVFSGSWSSGCQISISCGDGYDYFSRIFYFLSGFHFRSGFYFRNRGGISATSYL